MAERRTTVPADADAAAEDAALGPAGRGEPGRAPAVNPAHPDHLDGSVANRYGRTPGRRRRERGILIGGAAVLVVVLVAWVVWAGFGGGTDTPELEATDLGHVLLPEERAVEVTWSLSVPPGTPTACVIQALDEDYTVVGWKVVQIPAGDRDIRQFTDRVRTARTAVTGLINHCWVT